MSFGLLELGIALLIALGALRGFRRGLVREGLALGGLLLGLVLAAQWQVRVAALLKPFIGGGRLADGLAYLLVLLSVIGAATLLTVLVLRLVRLLLVGWLDRLGGAAFGAAQGAILAALLLFLAVKYPMMGLDQVVRESELGMAVLETLPRVLSYLPPELGPATRFFTLPGMS